MKIRMLVGLQGPTISLNPGDEYPNCDAAEARRLIEAGYAVAIEVTKPAERAVRRTPAKEKRG